MSTNQFLRALPAAEKEDPLKLTTVQELPKLRFATRLAVTEYPNTRRGRKYVLSHIEVYKMVESVAGKMREAGIRPGTVCAFALPTSCESIIFFYAIVWIAAIAAPIDPNLSEEDFEIAVKRSGAKLLVSPLQDDDSDDPLYLKCKSISSKLDILQWHIHRTINEGIKLNTHGNFMGSGAAWSGGSGDFKLDPEEIAIHLFSTNGFVPLSHYSLCEAAKAFISTYNLSVGMNTMLAPPLHDAHGILILISTFYSGGHIVLPGYGGFDSEKFWDFSKKHNLSWLSASPEQVLALNDEIDSGRGSSDANQQLLFVRSSGISIVPEVLEKIESNLKTPVFQSYGTAEAAGFVTTNIPSLNYPGTVGLPINGMEVAVFDVESRQLCKTGEVGEIAVRGKHAAGKYLDSEESTEEAIYNTEGNDEGDIKIWLGTGDRGYLNDEGFLTVLGNSKELRAEEIKVKELEAAAFAKAEEERKVKEAKEAEEQKKIDDERRIEDERIAAERRLEEERLEEERRLEKERREAEEEQERILAEEAAIKAAAIAKAEEEEKEKERARIAEKEEKARIENERNAALIRAGVDNPEDIDDETAAAILARLEAIEENHRRLREDVEGKNAAELEEMRKRVAEAEAEAERLKSALAANGKVVDLRMEELEAAVLAAAASAESSASNTREAVKAAREVADAAYGTNHSQPVEVKASTGDQGALTKTVKVSLDEVEKAMRTHPAVLQAKAFGRKDKRFGAEVYCAIEPKRGARVSEPWLKLHAQSVLPAPMVPKKFYYMSKIPDGISRKELSESNMLQDLSEFSGYSEVKHVKGPQWKPKQKRRTGL